MLCKTSLPWISGRKDDDIVMGQTHDLTHQAQMVKVPNHAENQSYKCYPGCCELVDYCFDFGVIMGNNFVGVWRVVMKNNPHMLQGIDSTLGWDTQKYVACVSICTICMQYVGALVVKMHLHTYYVYLYDLHSYWDTNMDKQPLLSLWT